MNAIITYLLNHWPWVVVVFVVIVIVWYVAKFYFKRFVPLEDKTTHLPCETHRSDLQSIKTTMAKLDAIGEQLSEITRWIMKLDPEEIDLLAPKFSPRRMTKAGINLYEMSGSKAVVDANTDSLIESIKAKNPLTPLDVEDTAYLVLNNRLSEPIFNGVKNYIYFQPEKIKVDGDDGEVTVTLSLALLLKLMSIDLRDRYLAKYKI